MCRPRVVWRERAVSMSSFSESALEKKLSELSNSQQSVQTLSLWIIHHRKHSSLIVRVWHRELKKGTREFHCCQLWVYSCEDKATKMLKL